MWLKSWQDANGVNNSGTFLEPRIFARTGAEVDVVGKRLGQSPPSPCYDRISWDASSGVNQEMNIFWQNVGNVPDDVTP